MPDDHRITLRLPSALHTQLEARTSRTVSLSDVVREALAHYLTCAAIPEAPASVIASDVTSRLTTVEARLTSVEAALASRQPVRHPHQTPRRAASDTGVSSDTTPTFDPARHVLGKACPRRHLYLDTGQSLLQRSNHKCVLCHREQARARRQAQRQG